MKILRTCMLIVVAGGTVAAASPVLAARGGYHPRRLEVKGRLYNQNRRINQGVRDGQLTHQEAHSLRSNDRAIGSEQREMAHLDGGHITRADQRSLNQQENANSKGIYADRHN